METCTRCGGKLKTIEKEFAVDSIKLKIMVRQCVNCKIDYVGNLSNIFKKLMEDIQLNYTFASINELYAKNILNFKYECHINNLISKLKLEKNIENQGIAKKFNITPQRLSIMKSQWISLTVSTAIELAYILNCNIDELYNITGKESSYNVDKILARIDSLESLPDKANKIIVESNLASLINAKAEEENITEKDIAERLNMLPQRLLTIKHTSLNISMKLALKLTYVLDCKLNDIYKVKCL